MQPAYSREQALPLSSSRGRGWDPGYLLATGEGLRCLARFSQPHPSEVATPHLGGGRDGRHEHTGWEGQA